MYNNLLQALKAPWHRMRNHNVDTLLLQLIITMIVITNVRVKANVVVRRDA